MKRGRSYSDNESEAESETEVQSVSVSNYHLVDDEDNPVTFAVLPIQWSDSENSGACKEKVFLDGDADSRLRKIFMQVTAWRFDLSSERPEVFLLAKDGRWIKLQKPRKGFRETIRSVFVTLYFLHGVKGKRQMSVGSLLQDLSQDKELSFYGFKPSKNDLSDHVLLIGEASKRDADLAKSKQLLLMVLEKLNSQKLLDEEVNDFEQPGLPVVGYDSDMIGKANEESEEMDALDVCALCDNGGNVTCCDGMCMRSFHATEEAGFENSCVSLGFTQKEVDEIPNFYCKNCEYRQHQCFACGKLGSSDEVNGAEVIKCASVTCDRFYHPHCVAKLLPEVVKHVTEEIDRNIADGNPFTCPLHYCCVCKGLENSMDPELQFAVCRRCPKAYHRKCLPREIIADNNVIQRAWEGLLPKNRILIYCLNHEIDPELGTPTRDHIKFPDTTVVQKKPSAKRRVILKKNIDIDKSSGKSISNGSKLTGKLSSDKVGGNKSSKKRIHGSNRSRKPKSKKPSRCLTENKMLISMNIEIDDSQQKFNQLTVGEKLHADEGSEQIELGNQINNVNNESLSLDADSEKRLLGLFKEATSSITLDSVLEKHIFASTHSHILRNGAEKTITMEKLEDSVNAVQSALRMLESGCSIQEAKAVCDPDVLKQIFKWKDELKIYLAPVLNGNRYTSYGHVEKLEGATRGFSTVIVGDDSFGGIGLSSSIADKLHWYVQNGDTIVDFSCEANDFGIPMKKRLEETGKKCSYRNYDFLPTKNDLSSERRDWMTVQPTTELPTGSQLIIGLSPPFSNTAALANEFIDKALEFKPKLLILISPPEIERHDPFSIVLNKKLSLYDLIWEDENFLLDTVSLSVSTCMEQRNISPPILSLWSRSDWTTKHKVIAREHGHVCRENVHNSDTVAAAVHATGGNYADNSKLTDDQEDQAAERDGQKRSLLYANVDKENQGEQEYRKGKSGKSRSKRKRFEESNITQVGVISPAKRQAVNKMPSAVADQTQSNRINGKSSALSGHDPSPGHPGNCNEQVISRTGSSCKTNTPAIGRSALPAGKLNHVKTSSLGSEPRTFIKRGSFGGGLQGFASCPNSGYASQHSCGWLEE
ncbi:unnamed protein product [Sphenostylis stenocarpa]|uniref:Zinc finger PHD-type domain-containing protein n=1 Tax=Sphenostylis stenocarpa TaxID=92480 RepID=A0AA86VNC7_9FABA|nr:unnamed protein product [Sphenostylis stenocarpa]